MHQIPPQNGRILTKNEDLCAYYNKEYKIFLRFLVFDLGIKYIELVKLFEPVFTIVRKNLNLYIEKRIARLEMNLRLFSVLASFSFAFQTKSIIESNGTVANDTMAVARAMGRLGN
jgi:hypothetical protein